MIITLPVEIWEHILYMLNDLRSIVNISATCRFFRALIKPLMLKHYTDVMLYNPRVRRYNYWRKLMILALPNYVVINDLPWMIPIHNFDKYYNKLSGYKLGLVLYPYSKSCHASPDLRTEKICRYEMKYGLLAFADIPHQTKSLCFLAINIHWENLGLIKKEYQTKQIIATAINKNLKALMYVVDQTDKLCLKCVRRNGLALQYVRNKTSEICYAAIRENPYALEFVEDQCEYQCLLCVKKCGMILKYVKDQNNKICRAAIKQNPSAIKFVKPTIELYELAMKIVNIR